jgi:phage recombination protein Bet
MGTALATTASNQLTFNKEQVELIKKTIAAGSTDDELKLFLYQSQRTGLDPLAKQIYFVKRNTKVNKKNAQGVWMTTYEPKLSIQTGVDGFRVIAERSGDYGGQDEPEFEYGSDGTTIKKATVKVYRWHGETRYVAAVGFAFWDEYVDLDDKGKPRGMWKDMPHNQIAKCAEVQGLKKAYPQDLSGLTSQEEMEREREITIDGGYIPPEPAKEPKKQKAADGITDVTPEATPVVEPEPVAQEGEIVESPSKKWLRKLVAGDLLKGDDALTKPIEEYTDEEAKEIVLKFKNKGR